MTILDTLDDQTIFASQFRDPETWKAWRAFLAALFALPMDEDMRSVFAHCTSRQEPPVEPVQEAWLVIGRRGGKSFVLALVAIYLAAFKDWRPFLGPGERATVMVIAADRKQARVIMRYCLGLLRAVPMLNQIIEGATRETINLSSRVTIEVHSASFRTTRGYSICAALCDEMAFWRDEESANPDVEVIAALRPAMATIPGAMLLCASSPYARRGALWNAYRKHFGQENDPVLVWQAPSKLMNPSIPQRGIDQALEDDPAHARAEWLAEFRSDIESYITREAIEAVMSRGVRERAPIANIKYCGFIDPSGGSADSMTMAIAHREGGTAVLDCLREVRPPFSPEAVVTEFAADLKRYGISRVCGDRYGGEFPREQFRKRGIDYRASQKPKSDLYRDFLPSINSGSVELLDNGRLLSQLVGLERRSGRSGRDLIDHPPGGHDDLANAAAGAIDLALAERRQARVSLIAPIVVNAHPEPINLNRDPELRRW